MKHLKKEDFNIIMESLRYSKKAFEDYKDHPSQEFKAERVASVVNVMNRIKEELKDWED